jgi:DNA polymerase-3 subunit beta
MKIILKRKEVIRSFANIQGIVEKNNIIPILSNVLLEAKADILSLYATNLRVSFLDECPAITEKEGSIALDSKKIFEIIKESPGEDITIEKKENNRVKISSEKVVYTLAGNNPLEFPEKIKMREREPSKITTTKLNEMIRKTLFAVAEDESKGSMGGILWEVLDGKEKGLRMVATDAHRLSCIERREGEGEEFKKELHGVILPKKGVQELRKLLEEAGAQTIGVWKEEGNLLIKKDRTILAIRLIEGEVPDYKRVLAFQGEDKIKLRTLQTIDALRRVSIVLEEKLRSIKILLSPGAMGVVAYGGETGEAREDIEVEYNGSEREICLNLKYLWDSLNCLDDETFLLEIRGAKEPVRILPEKDSDHILVVMPMVF